jgi:hypothetical protein
MVLLSRITLQLSMSTYVLGYLLGIMIVNRCVEALHWAKVFIALSLTFPIAIVQGRCVGVSVACWQVIEIVRVIFKPVIDYIYRGEKMSPHLPNEAISALLGIYFHKG